MSTETHQPKSTPAHLVIGLGLLVALSALVFGVIAGVNRAWFMMGFEIVCVVAGLLTLVLRRTGLGLGSGFGLGAASLAGTIAGASFLGAIGADRMFLGWFGTPLFGVTAPAVRLEFDPLLLARLAVSIAMALVAGWVVLTRHPRVSFGALGRAGIVAGVAVLIAGVAWVGRGQFASMNGAIQTILIVTGFLLMTGLVSAFVHLVVHAFAPASERDA